jgi:hypothetical protein
MVGGPIFSWRSCPYFRLALTGLGGGFDADPSLPEGKDLGAGDSVVGQVENGGGSIGARGSRLDQGS